MDAKGITELEKLKRSMARKEAKLKLYISARGRLQRATLIIEEESAEAVPVLLRERALLKPVKRVMTEHGVTYFRVALGSILRAADWKLDIEEETGISVRMKNQRDETVPLPRKIFRNPQYL